MTDNPIYTLHNTGDKTIYVHGEALHPGKAAQVWDDTHQRWVHKITDAPPTVPAYVKPHVPGAGALLLAMTPTRDGDDASDAMTYTMAELDVAMHRADIENRTRDAGPDLFKTLKALFAVVGARHLTADTLHAYLRAKDLIERMEGAGS